MLLSMMRRTKLDAFGKMPAAPSGIRHGDRVTTHGSNVNLDQNEYRVLYALSELTGDLCALGPPRTSVIGSRQR
jgi:hypothetical protein